MKRAIIIIIAMAILLGGLSYVAGNIKDIIDSSNTRQESPEAVRDFLNK